MFCLFLLPLLSVTANTVTKAKAEAHNERKITVEVKIAEDFVPKNIEEWTLYVYAAMPNSRVPLANFKGKLSELPKKVELLESMYLLPHMTLQQADKVVVIAKATTSTDPHKKLAEDIIGYSQPINFSAGAHQKSQVIISQFDLAKSDK
mgnify:FL=1